MQNSHPSRQVVKFGVFEADLAAGELRKKGVKLRLQEQPFLVLSALLENPGRLVSRDELRKKLWPSDTFIDFDKGLNTAINKIREALGDSAEKPRFVETLSRRGYRFLEPLHLESSNAINSIAVLPLENLSRDPDQEYFADGLTEALITNLSKISALRVVSRTTAMSFKGTHSALPEIVRELGVDAIVEGAVSRSGDRVCISARLVNAHTDFNLWAESYDSELRDVLALQSEVARAVARQIQVKLTPQERAHLERVRVVRPEAYEAYLKGRYYWNKRDGEGVKRCAEYFQQAIEIDPSYAAAYAGLADSAGVAGWWGSASPEQGCGRAKAAAQKSLEIEETAEAHASLGWALLYYDWDFSGSEKQFLRAIELNPLYATAHQWYGHCLLSAERFEEASAEFKEALRLDPLSSIIRTSYAGFLWAVRENDEAITQCQKILDVNPNFLGSHWALGVAYEGKEMFGAAIDEFKKGIAASGEAPLFLGSLGHAYATSGARESALEILRRLDELSKVRYVSSCWPGIIHGALGNIPEAISWLERAVKERAEWIAHLRVLPVFDSLRSDPRFRNLERRVGFRSL